MEQHYLYTVFNILPSAYIDPGTGSMLLQVIISAILGTTFFFRGLIAGAVLWIRNKLFRGSTHESNKKSSKRQS